MSSSVLGLYWHTLRHLRPVQVYGRLWFRFAKPRPDLRTAPAIRISAKDWNSCARAPNMTGPDRFRFLDVEHTLASAEDWNNRNWPKLWRYNAHYFDDLIANETTQHLEWHQALLGRWVAENPPGLLRSRWRYSSMPC